MTHVPYKGAAEALTALLGGQTDLMFASLSSSIPLIKAGQSEGVRRDRSAALAVDTGTADDRGSRQSAGLRGSRVVRHRRRRPACPLRPWQRSARQRSRRSTTTEVKNRMFASGVEIRTSTPEEFARYIESEMEKWAKVVKASGAKVD